MRILLLALVAVTAAHAADLPPTSEIISNTLARRTARAVYVLHLGQYYHRYDHVVAPGARELSPEAALANGFSRCPECLPPKTTDELEKEAKAGGAKISKYYASLLDSRDHPNEYIPAGTDLPKTQATRVAPTPIVVVPNNGQYVGGAPAAGGGIGGAPAPAPAGK